METMQNDVHTEDLFENMSVELCKLLKKNLFKIFNPIMDEKNKTDEILLNFPLTKQLTEKVKELEERIIEINCMKSLRIFSLNQKIEEQKNEIRELKNKLRCQLEEKIEKKEENNINSIKLEVNEIDSEREVVDVNSLNMSIIKNKKINELDENTKRLIENQA